MKKRKKNKENRPWRLPLVLRPFLAGYVCFVLLLFLVGVYSYATGSIDLFSLLTGYLAAAVGAFVSGFYAFRLFGGNKFLTGLFFSVPTALGVLVTLSVLAGKADAHVLITLPVCLAAGVLGAVCASVGRR